MSNPKQGKSKDGKLMHYSVGALIKKDGKYLLIDRVKPPLGFAGIAGHIDEGEDEIKALKFVQDGAKISWDVTANITKEVDLGEVVSKIIIKALKKLDAEENLTSDYFSLFEKFCV